MSACKNCAKYKGNCGNHFKDCNGHTLWDVPSESMFDGVIGNIPSCFEPSIQYKEEQTMNLVKALSKYPIDILKRAIEYAEENNE